MVGFLEQFYDILKDIMQKILSNKCTVCNGNLLVRCNCEECYCSLIVNTVFSNSSLQGNFLTQPAITDAKLQQILLVRKRKHVSQTETACSSGLLCDLIITCLQVQPGMIKALCFKFYLDKIAEILTAQDLSFIIASSGKCIQYIMDVCILLCICYTWQVANPSCLIMVVLSFDCFLVCNENSLGFTYLCFKWSNFVQGRLCSNT